MHPLKSIQSYLIRHRISLATLLTLIVLWQMVAYVSPKDPASGTFLVPPWESIFGSALKGLSDYWKINFLAPVPSTGGEQTYLGAFLAVVYHSALSIMRLVLGLVLGAIAGVVLGLLISLSSTLKRLIAFPLHLLRMCPLLAMVPLFQFWFGTELIGSIIFIAYGVGVIYLVGTLNAVANVPRRYVEYAATLGVSKFVTYSRVILPAILPELFSSVFITLGLAWTAVIGAEYVGVENGLGRMIIWAEFFSQTDRMALITLFILLFASISFIISRKVSAYVLRWMPTQYDYNN